MARKKTIYDFIEFLQRNLQDVDIERDPEEDEDEDSFRGFYKNIYFFVSWVDDTLFLSMDTFSPALVNTFSAILGYKPLCRYECKRTRTHQVVWDNNEPGMTFVQLSQDPCNINLVRMQ
jgi:hypothetical protein